MALVTLMVDKKNNPKLTSRTPSVFKEAVEDLKVQLQRERRWLYCGEKISLEAIVNVAVFEFLRMEPEARAAAFDRRIPQLEAMFETETMPGPDPKAGVIIGDGHEETKKGHKKGKAG